MASSIPAQGDGFFSSKGGLNTDSLRSSGFAEWQEARKAGTDTSSSSTSSSSSSSGSASNSTSSSSDVAEQVASGTASAIADAAVVQISNKLNAADFTSGVSDLVQAAVAQGLKNLGSTSVTPAKSQIPHGTYQNQLIAQSDAARAKTKAQTQVQPEVTPVSDPNAATPPPQAAAPKTAPNAPAAPNQSVSSDKSKHGKEVAELAKKYVANYEKAGHKLSDDERSKKIKEVTNFYGAPGREGRLQALVDKTA